MAINLDGANGLFPIFRDVIAAFDSINTHQATTLPALIDTLLTEQADSDTVDGESLAHALVVSINANSTRNKVQTALRSYFSGIIINRVVADAPQVPANLDNCLDELLRQIDADAGPATVEENVVSVAVATTPSGTDEPTIAVSATGPDGRTLQQMIPETLVGVYASVTSLSITGGDDVSRLAPTWPDGSKASTALSIGDVGLLSNNSLNTDANRADTPDAWIVNVGQIGTTVTLTTTEVQDLVVSGPPTSGHFVLKHTRATDSFEQSTIPLAFDASAADVQTALRALKGLEGVTVTYTATTYTVNFLNADPPGDQNILTATDTFDVGAVTPAQTTAGEASHSYRALEILGDGAELTHVRQLITGVLLPNTVYAFSMQGRKISATTGTMLIALTDGADATINDDEGTANSLSVDLSTLTEADFGQTTTFFRTPKVLPEIVYMSFKLTVAIPATKGIKLDSLILKAATQLYTPGGPYAAALDHNRQFQIGDRYTITVTNDYAGLLQTRFGQFFERQLKSATSGAETITDA